MIQAVIPNAYPKCSKRFIHQKKFVLLIQVQLLFQEVNYDSPRGGVSVITEKGDVTTSYLLIQKAKYSDSGSYKCIPSNANPLTAHVHVMNGSYVISNVQITLSI